MKKNIHAICQKIKASTMVEAVVALTILLVFIFLGMMILTNIDKNRNSDLKLRAHIVSDYFINYTLEEKRYFDEEFNDAGMKLEKKVMDIGSGILEIEINVYNYNDLLLLNKKQIIKTYYSH